MKVTITDECPTKEEMDVIKEESKNIPEISKEALREKIAGATEIKLSRQVADSIRELGMTPDEFVAKFLNDIGLSH